MMIANGISPKSVPDKLKIASKRSKSEFQMASHRTAKISMKEWMKSSCPAHIASMLGTLIGRVPITRLSDFPPYHTQDAPFSIMSVPPSPEVP